MPEIEHDEGAVEDSIAPLQLHQALPGGGDAVLGELDLEPVVDIERPAAAADPGSCSDARCYLRLIRQHAQQGRQGARRAFADDQWQGDEALQSLVGQ